MSEASTPVAALTKNTAWDMESGLDCVAGALRALGDLLSSAHTGSSFNHEDLGQLIACVGAQAERTREIYLRSPDSGSRQACG